MVAAHVRMGNGSRHKLFGTAEQAGGHARDERPTITADSLLSSLLPEPLIQDIGFSLHTEKHSCDLAAARATGQEYMSRKIAFAFSRSRLMSFTAFWVCFICSVARAIHLNSASSKIGG